MRCREQMGCRGSCVGSIRLTALAGEGLSAKQIASALSGEGFQVSRNGVIGKLRRIKVKLLGAPSTAGGNNGGNKPSAPPPRPVPVRKIMPVESPNCAAVNLVDLGRSHCRFPKWDGDGGAPDYPHCGAPAATGSVYCDFHARQCSNRGRAAA